MSGHPSRAMCSFLPFTKCTFPNKKTTMYSPTIVLEREVG